MAVVYSYDGINLGFSLLLFSPLAIWHLSKIDTQHNPSVKPREEAVEELSFRACTFFTGRESGKKKMFLRLKEIHMRVVSMNLKKCSIPSKNRELYVQMLIRNQRLQIVTKHH